MRCTFCGFGDTQVIDTRSIKSASIIKRRRFCTNCKHKFTTYERIEEIPLRVIKQNNHREPFSVEKLREGILRAVEKRPISSETVEQIITEVQQEIAAKFTLEVPSKTIGKMVLERLFNIDAVAYIRFASVYYHYDSIENFLAEVRKLKRAYKKKIKSKEQGTL
ncbi:MAG: transcriptional regulator NrdR [Endomicrobiia bacterium]